MLLKNVGYIRFWIIEKGTLLSLIVSNVDIDNDINEIEGQSSDNSIKTAYLYEFMAIVGVHIKKKILKCINIICIKLIIQIGF